MAATDDRHLIGRGAAATPRSYGVVRWLEYSGVLVVLGVLADAANDGIPVTAIVSSTALCNETVYSALAVGVELGLVTFKAVGRGIPVLKRYRLTESGLPLGRIAQQARDVMSGFPPPPRKKLRRPFDSNGELWASASRIAFSD